MLKSYFDTIPRYENMKYIFPLPFFSSAFHFRFPHLGFSDKSTHYVYPEEAVYLAETSRLVVSFDSVLVTDFRRLYTLLLGRSGTLGPSPYGLYSRVSKGGSRLRRLRRYPKNSDDQTSTATASKSGGDGGIGAKQYLASILSKVGVYRTDYRYECRTGKLSCFASTNS